MRPAGWCGGPPYGGIGWEGEAALRRERPVVWGGVGGATHAERKLTSTSSRKTKSITISNQKMNESHAASHWKPMRTCSRAGELEGGAEGGSQGVRGAKCECGSTSLWLGQLARQARHPMQPVRSADLHRAGTDANRRRH